MFSLRLDLKQFCHFVCERPIEQRGRENKSLRSRAVNYNKRLNGRYDVTSPLNSSELNDELTAATDEIDDDNYRGARLGDNRGLLISLNGCNHNLT